jgi:4-cresol dehydrogenase (hydroxylating)
MKGVPTSEPLASMYWRKRTPPPAQIDPDRDGCGLLWLAPIVPAHAPEVEQLTGTVSRIMLEDGFEPMISLTLNERSIACVVSISYDRDVPGEDDRAMFCCHRLFKTVASQGYRPYRLGIHSMEEMQACNGYGTLLRAIKNAVAPAGILSAGRYQ